MLPGRISDRGSSMLVRRVVIASTPSRSALLPGCRRNPILVWTEDTTP